MEPITLYGVIWNDGQITLLRTFNTYDEACQGIQKIEVEWRFEGIPRGGWLYLKPLFTHLKHVNDILFLANFAADIGFLTFQDILEVILGRDGKPKLEDFLTLNKKVINTLKSIQNDKTGFF